MKGELVGRARCTVISLAIGRGATCRRLARQEYRAFVAEGAKQGSRPDLQGGGLIRSAGGWAAVQELRRGREGYVGDERILGGTEFVERIRHEVEERKPQEQRQPEITLDGVVERVCRAVGVRVEEVAGSGRQRIVDAKCRRQLDQILFRANKPLSAPLEIHPVPLERTATAASIFILFENHDLMKAGHYRLFRDRAFTTWREATTSLAAA